MTDVPLQQLLDEHAPAYYKVRPLAEALIVFFAVLLATFTTVYFIYAHALEAQKGEIRQGLLRTANIVRTQIDPELHKTFDSPELEQSPQYIAQEDRLMTIRFSDPTIAFIWTGVLRDGKVLFVLDPTPAPAEGEEDLRVALLEEFPNPPEEVLRALQTRETVISPEPYTDKWGSFVSAYVPLYDAQGGYVGVIGVDIYAEEYFRRLAPIKRATVRAMVTAFFIAFLAGSAVWFLRNFIQLLNARRIALYDEFRRRLSRLLAAREQAESSARADRREAP